MLVELMNKSSVFSMMGAGGGIQELTMGGALEEQQRDACDIALLASLNKSKKKWKFVQYLSVED